MSETKAKPSWKTDVLVFAGVLACMGLGILLTNTWMTRRTVAAQAVSPAEVRRGQPLDIAAAGGVVDPTAPVGTEPGAIPALPSGPLLKDDEEYPSLSFEVLASYYYELPEDTIEPVAQAVTQPPKDQIPQPIRALDGRKITLQGFMVPIDLKNGKTTRFMLMRDRSLCCFQRVPRMNEWISVRMQDGKHAKWVNDQPVTVVGKIEVGEQMKDGEIQSIYRMDAVDVFGPLDL